MAQITTEITSSKIVSDNPIHQRLLYAYEAAKNWAHGSLLEVGCGEGRGLEILSGLCTQYTAIDKNLQLLHILKNKYPHFSFIHRKVPPFDGLPDHTFDTVIAFQVIEHIKNDHLFVGEIARVLKPGGTLILTTPNQKLSLTRNPWHIREYTFESLQTLLEPHFKHVVAQGVSGNQNVWEYYTLNKKSVEKYTRWDVLRMQYWLPASLLKIPYDILNRMNRNTMHNKQQNLVRAIKTSDFYLTSEPAESLDLFFVATK